MPFRATIKTCSWSQQEFLTVFNSIWYISWKWIDLHGFSYHFRFEWRLYFSVFQAFPVNPTEESMFTNISLPFWAAAQTLWRVFCHQLRHKTIYNLYCLNRKRLIVTIIKKDFSLWCIWSSLNFMITHIISNIDRQIAWT